MKTYSVADSVWPKQSTQSLPGSSKIILFIIEHPTTKKFIRKFKTFRDPLKIIASIAHTIINKKY